MKFALSEMTALKFFVPLIEEGNRRQIRSTVFVERSNKYNCPFRHSAVLKEVSSRYNFDLVDISISRDARNDTVFTIEGASRNSILNKKQTVSLYCSTDFTLSYDSYVNDVDHVVLGSKFVADYYKKNDKKVVCLGSPKFDVEIDKKDVLKKYRLSPDKRRVTIFYPRLRDVSACNIEGVTKAFRDRGYEIVLKTRGKDPYARGHVDLVDHAFYDESWHPSTAMELITVSDLIFNFSSTVIEETTALRKPMINFHVKPFAPTFDFLYQYDFVKNVTSVDQTGECIDHFESFTPNDYEAANEKLFDTRESSKSIIDMLI